MDSKLKIKQELQAIESRLAAIKQQEDGAKLKAITDRLQSTAAALAHDQKAAAYLSWYESKSYVESIREGIEKDGTTAHNPVTGVSCKLQLSADGKTARTFGHLKGGSILEIQGRPNLVEKFDHSPAGSTAALLPMNSTYQATDRPVTPYSAVPCNFDRATKTLTVSPADRLSPGSQLVIDGIKYALTAQIGVDSNMYRYELEVTGK